MRLKAWLKFKETNDENDFTLYKQAKNNVVQMVKNAKRNFEAKLAQMVKQKRKLFYNYVRKKSKVKAKVGPLEDLNGDIIHNDMMIGEMLNKFFTSVFVKEDTTTLPIIHCNDNIKNIEILKVEIKSNDVLQKLLKLREDKAPGEDEISCFLLKRIAEEVCQPLSLIYTSSMLEGVVPLDWKMANITPIFKKGKKSEPGNYRPVSLTSEIGKILELILKDKIVEYLKTNSLIKESQHGFMSRKSCLTNLLEFSEFVSKALDSGEPLDIIYLDFKKAFDTVPHERLLLKIESLGVRGEIVNWVCS
jgi:hypothetical protein